MTIRIGSRASQLARWQAEWVKRELTQRGVDADIIYISTLGDRKSDPIAQVGAEGLFTREIQNALLRKEVDVAVHSLKDLPTAMTDGLSLGAVPQRAPCGDALVANNVTSIDELPADARVGTGSSRRRAQLLAARPDLDVCDLRGNVDTRLKRVRAGEFEAIILAEAGLRRLGLESNISQVIPKSVMLPAVGQGALGLEIRSDDSSTRDALSPLHDPATHCAVTAERAMLRSLRGGCLAPIGAWARIEGEELKLDAVVLDPDGRTLIRASHAGSPQDCDQLGIRTAEELTEGGAAELLESVR